MNDTIGKMKFIDGNYLEIDDKLYLLMLGESGRLSLLVINLDLDFSFEPKVLFKFELCEVITSGWIYIEELNGGHWWLSMIIITSNGLILKYWDILENGL